MKIKVLLGAIRHGRKSEAVAQLVMERLSYNRRIEPELIDLRDYPFPLLEQRVDEMAEPPAGFTAFSAALEKADGIIIVAPEYKGGIPGVLKNALDYLKPRIFYHIPVGIVTLSSGIYGGINCLSQLRLTVLALGGVPIPEHLSVSFVNELLEGANRHMNKEKLIVKTDQFINGFSWYVERLMNKQEALLDNA